MRLQGKVAVVTGGRQGIGQTIALTLAKEGADVAIYDYNWKTTIAVADEIKAMGRQTLAIKCDISNLKDLNEATDQVIDKLKKIDILVNNAGVGEPMASERVTETFWDRIININLRGTFFVLR